MLHYNHSTIGDSHSFVLHCSPWERLFILYFYRTSGKTWALKLQQASPHPTKFLHFHFDIDFGKGIKRALFPLRLHLFRWVCLPTSQHTISVAHRFQFQLRLPLGHVFVCINLRHATNQRWVTFVINSRNNQHIIIIIIIIITFMISVTCSPSDLNVPMEFKYW